MKTLTLKDGSKVELPETNEEIEAYNRQVAINLRAVRKYCKVTGRKPTLDKMRNITNRLNNA